MCIYEWVLVSRSLFHADHKFRAYFVGKWLKIFLVVSSKHILVFLNSYKVLLNFLNVSSNCSSNFDNSSKIFLEIFWNNFWDFLKYSTKYFEKIIKIFKNFTRLFSESIFFNFLKYFSKMSKQLSLMLDNVIMYHIIWPDIRTFFRI